MIRIMEDGHPARDGTTRREVLRAGGLSLFASMTLPQLLDGTTCSTSTPR
jgi:hypothetical protein